MKIKMPGFTGGFKDIPRRSWLAALLVLVSGLIVTVLLVFSAKADLEKDTRSEFDLSGDQITQKIETRFNVQTQLLYSAAAYLAASHTVTRQDWQTFTQHLSLESQYPGIQGLGYAAIIPAAQLPDHLKQIRAEGFPDYKVWPEDKRDFYTSILYLEPFSERNLRALGYDMFTEPVRRAALERARDSNSAALSGKVALVQENGQDVQAGILLFVPVYQHGLPIDTIAQRRAAVLGWVYSPFRMNDLISSIIGDLGSQAGKTIQLEIFDGDQLSPASLLYSSQPASFADRPDGQVFTSLKPVDFAGERWSLHFTESVPSVFTGEQGKISFYLLGGTLISVLLFWLMIALLTTRANAQRMAAHLTKELRTSEEKIRAIINSADDIFFTLDHEQRYTGVFGHWFEKIQRTPDHFLGRTAPEILGDRDQSGRDRFEANQRALAGESAEYEMVMKAGEKLRYFHMVVSPLRNANGEISGILVLGREVTKFKQVEDELKSANRVLEEAGIVRQAALEKTNQLYAELAAQQDSQFDKSTQLESLRERYFNLYDLAPAGYCTLSPTGLILEANLTAANLLGVSRESMLNYPLNRFIEKDCQDAYYAHRNKFIQTGTPQIDELQLVKQDGTIFWAQVETSYSLGNSKEHQARVLISDVSERKRTESLLQVTEERLGALAEYSRAITWEVDAGWLYTYVSSTCLSMLGFSSEEIVGKKYFFDLHPEEGRRQFQEEAFEFLDRQIPFRNLENKLQTRDGQVIWVSTNGLPILDHNGMLTGYRGVDTDITARKQVEDALQESNAILSAFMRYSPMYVFIKAVTSSTSRVLKASDNYLDMVGLPAAEMTGKSMEELFPLDLAEQMTADDWAVVSSGRVLKTEEELNRRIYSSFKFPFSVGENTLLAGYSIDITERKHIEQALALAATHLSLAVRAGGVGTWKYDFITERLTWDDQMCHLYGITPQKFNGEYEAWLKGVHPQDRERGDYEIQAARRGEKEFDTEFRVVWPDGSIHEIRALALVQRDQAGKALAMLGTNWDITKQKLADKTLRYAHWRLESIIEGTQAGTWEWNVQSGEMNISNIWGQMIGYSLAELAPTNFQTLNLRMHSDDLVRSKELFARHFLGQLANYDCELRVKHKDGHWVWVHDRGQVITWTAAGHPLLMFGTRTDISVRKASDEKIRLLNIELESLSLTDFLTNLSNRRYFMLRGAEAIKRVTRNKEPLALIMLDIDLFKQINDNYGHDVGDMALQHVAGLLKSSLREIDFPARIGGEEFAVLLPNTDQYEAGVLAERVRKLVHDTPFENAGEAITTSISIGAAVFEKGMADIGDLLRNADVAMYEAKRSGRNCVVIYQDNLPPPPPRGGHK